MIVNHMADNSSAVQEARQQLRCLNIPWFDVDQKSAEVVKAHPSIKGNALTELIIQEVLNYHASGMGCC